MDERFKNQSIATTTAIKIAANKRKLFIFFILLSRIYNKLSITTEASGTLISQIMPNYWLCFRDDLLIGRSIVNIYSEVLDGDRSLRCALNTGLHNTYYSTQSTTAKDLHLEHLTLSS